MIRYDMVEKMEPKDSCNTRKCVFCCSSDENEEAHGKMLRKAGITIHYFCMLFSSGLWQRGKKDSDGILGFMPADIRREQKRGFHMVCDYCHGKGATVVCAVKACQRNFHFRCGREAGGLCQFYDQFRAYCPGHSPQQTVPAEFPKVMGPTTCCICMMSVNAFVSKDTLCAPCCGGSWFHRICIQRYAVSAGKYFFKCPLCNNRELFEAEMLKFGIYIPEQDASWEREPNAYQDLLERYRQCDATTCICPQGRKYKGYAGSPWEIQLCSVCGSSGTHVKCCGLITMGNEKTCTDCSKIVGSCEKKLTERSTSSSTVTSPRVAKSIEEVCQLVENQRASLMKARRLVRRRLYTKSRSESDTSSSNSLSRLQAADRHNNNESNSDDKMPSTSTSMQYQDTDESTESEDGLEEINTMATPSLLEDHRLISCVPFVRIERASMELEVNVTESSEEKEEDEQVFTDPGCARLISLQQLISCRQGLQQKSEVAGSSAWDVQEVKEEGQNKVVMLLSMNQQHGSISKEGTAQNYKESTSQSSRQSDTEMATRSDSESCVQSTAAALWRRLTIQPSSLACNSEETDSEADDQNIQSLTMSRDQMERSQVQLPNTSADRKSSSDDAKEKSTEKAQHSPFLITSAHIHAIRQMIPNLRTPPQQAEHYEVFEISDDSSSSDQEAIDSVSNLSSTDNVAASKPGTSQTEDLFSGAHSGPQIVPVSSGSHAQFSSLPLSSLFQTPRQVTDSSQTQITRTISDVSTCNVEHYPSAEKNLKRRRRGRPKKVRKATCPPGNQQLPCHTQTPSILPCENTANQNKQTEESGVMFHTTLAQAHNTDQHQLNSGTSDRSGQIFPVVRVQVGKNSGHALQNATIPDDVIAMHQPVPEFFQFQGPRHQNFIHPATSTPMSTTVSLSNAVNLSAAGSLPSQAAPAPQTCVTVTSKQPVPARSWSLNSATGVRFPAMMPDIRPALRECINQLPKQRTAEPSTVWTNPSSSATQTSNQQHTRLSASAPQHYAITQSATETSTTPEMKTSLLSANPGTVGVNQIFYIPVPTSQPSQQQPFQLSTPTSQPFQLGVIALQPQETAKSSTVKMPATATLMATAQPQQQQHPNISNTAASGPQIIKLVPSSSMPLLQWIPVSECFAANVAPTQRTVASYPNPDHPQTQFSANNPPVVPIQTASSALQLIPPNVWQNMSQASVPYSANNHQASSVSTQPTPPVLDLTDSNSQVSQAGNSNNNHQISHRSPFSAGHTASSMEYPRLQSVGQPSFSARSSNSSILANAGAANYSSQNPMVAAVNSLTPAVVSRTQVVAQSDSTHSAHSADQPASLLATRTQPADPSVLVSQACLRPGMCAPTSSGEESNSLQGNKRVAEGNQGTPVPVSLYTNASFPAYPLISRHTALGHATPESVSSKVSFPADSSKTLSQTNPNLAMLLNTGSSCSEPSKQQQSDSAAAGQVSETGRHNANIAASTPQTATAAMRRPPSSSQVAQVPPTATATVQPALYTSQVRQQSDPDAPSNSQQRGSDRSCSMTRKDLETASQPVVILSDEASRQSVKSNQPTKHEAPPAAKPQQSSLSTQENVPSVVAHSSDGDNSLAVSRGKIWLTSLAKQSQLSRNDVVMLSDSDNDGDDLEIMNMSTTHSGSEGGSKHIHSGHCCGHSEQKKNTSPQITGMLVRAPTHRTCPVHGHFRLINRENPPMVTTRNADGSLSIDLTDEGPTPKRACTDRNIVTIDLDGDSDLEILN